MSDNSFIEIFDRERLQFIINNESYFKSYLGCDDDEKYAQFSLYKKYLNKGLGVYNNLAPIKYNKINGGRRFALGGISLQSFNYKVRGYISADLYYDIDIRNAHPCILKDICQKHNFNSRYLNLYVFDRDNTIQDIIDVNPKLSICDVKKAILSTMNGGVIAYNNINEKTIWLKNFKKEVDEIRELISEWFPEQYNSCSTKFNKNGKVLASIICETEDKILSIMVNQLKKFNIIDKIAVLTFDGIMIPKNNDVLNSDKRKKPKHEIDMDLLVLLENEIQNKMGFEIKLKFKNLDNDIADNINDIKKAIKCGLMNTVSDGDDDELTLAELNKKEYLETDYYWYDFIKGAQKPFDSLNELKEYFSKNINKVVFKIYSMDNTFIRKISPSNMFQFDKILCNECFTYTILSKEKVIYTNITLKSLLEKMGYIKMINRYDDIDFRPIGVSESEYRGDDRKFNTWSGFKAQLVDEIDMSKIDIILNHIKKVWCSNNIEHYNYMLNWFRKILTKPTEKSKIALVLKSSEKQIGKGIIINDFLIPFVIGNQYSMSVAGLNSVSAKFNQLLMNKLFINCDELSTLEGNYHNNFDILKKRITDKTINIEIKGGRSFIYPDYSNYVFCTNNDFTIKVEQGDSRYFMLECSPCYKGDFNYFNKLSKALNQESANHFLTYIVNMFDFEIPEIEIRNIPMTDLKRDMMIHSMHSSLRFLMAVQDGILHNEDGLMKSKTLYNHYVKWCDSTGEKSCSLNLFARNIKQSIEKVRSNGSKYILDSIDLKL